MSKEIQRILLLVGFSAAGKSSIAKELRNNYGYALIEHQPLVHQIAREQGFQRARLWLAQVGIEKFISESTQRMILQTNTLHKQEENKIVIDVTYGPEMLNNFKQNFPELYVIAIAILAEQSTRNLNIQQRMGQETTPLEAQNELSFRDNFLTTAGILTAIQACDISIHNSRVQSISDISYEVNQTVEKYISTTFSSRTQTSPS